MNESSDNKRGGTRTGAGRKIGTGKFGETTTVVRIPESQAPVIKDFLANAITVDQMGAAGDMAGAISGVSEIQLSYDIDNNVQRGGGSAGTNVPVTVVGIGLATGQFVVATGTISATTLSGSASLAAAYERNYTA